MGKASKWFRGLLGLKKPDSIQPQPPSSSSEAKAPKKKWSFVKSYREKDQTPRSPMVIDHEQNPSMHAIAVAAATAAVAEAAVAAAQAAAEVVRLTSSGRAGAAICGNGRATSFGSAKVAAASQAEVSTNGRGSRIREEWAATIIQSHFRAYLARRALRALKALVRLQAIVRGRIDRRRCANELRLRELRSHALATGGRIGAFESPHKACHLHYQGPATPEKFEHLARAKSMKHGESVMYKRSGSKNRSAGSNQNCRIVFKSWGAEGSNAGGYDEEINDKVLEVDSGRPPTIGRRRNLFHSSHLSIGTDQYGQSFITEDSSAAHQRSFEVQSMSPFQFSCYVDEDLFCTAESSPQLHSTSSKGDHHQPRGPFTPTRSDGSRSCMSGYSDYPNYMSCTESSKAKMRSLSAPRQRAPQYERSSSAKRLSIHGFVGESRLNPQRVSSTLHANFANKAYPGSGRLDRLGMPIREEGVGFSGGLWN